MRQEVKTSIHNRFLIEKRDALTNELKQSGIAENTVLNKMYERLCNHSSYFTHIQFGSGTGNSAPVMEHLFEFVGAKEAEDEELIRAFPTSSYTRKITIQPDEFVNETIREVGIAYGTDPNYLVTHALIKDAEGNQLEINKTALDVIVIYATVYITLNDTEHVKFSKKMYVGQYDLFNTNRLLEYFLNVIPYENYNSIQIGCSDYNLGFSCNQILAEYTPEIEADISNKQRIYRTRVQVDDANKHQKISEIGLNEVLRYQINSQHQISDVTFAICDGETTSFTFPFENYSNLLIKVDGQEVNNYVVNNIGRPYYKTLAEYIEPDACDIYKYLFSDVKESSYTFTFKNKESKYKLKNSLNGKILSMKLAASGYGTAQIRIYSSEDGNEYIYHGYKNFKGEYIWNFLVPNNHLFWKIENASENIRGSECVVIDDLNTIEFETPPAEGAVISASMEVPYLPKDENYIVDIEIALKFGEGDQL